MNQGLRIEVPKHRSVGPGASSSVQVANHVPCQKGGRSADVCKTFFCESGPRMQCHRIIAIHDMMATPR